MKSQVACLLLTLLAAVGLVACSETGTKTTQLGPDEAAAIATDAYVYGYSLMTTEVTRVQMSNVSERRD